jgi:hypothetical protein
MPASNQDKGRK